VNPIASWAKAVEVLVWTGPLLAIGACLYGPAQAARAFGAPLPTVPRPSRPERRAPRF
jgi:hypothetical protein